MANLQQQIIEALNVKPVIDVDEEIRKRVAFLKEHVLKANSLGLLVAVSGGLDSAVAVALCKIATDELTEEHGRESGRGSESKREYETLALLQPYGEQEDIEDSYAVVKAFSLQAALTNIEEAVDEIALEVEFAMKSLGQHRHVSIPGKGNIMARTRMVMQYALAFERSLLVCGTDHASEAVAGFFTKYGDGAVDLHPLGSLTKRQVSALAEKLGVPRSIIDKVPTAGLWAGQNDEEELGVSYDDNCDYLEGKAIDPKAQAKLEQHYVRSEHKRSLIPRI